MRDSISKSGRNCSKFIVYWYGIQLNKNMEYQLISLLIDHLTELKDRKNANLNSSFRADLGNTISMLKQLRKYW